MRRGLAVLAGGLLASAFPPLDVAGMAWIAPGLLLFAARGRSPFAIGYLGGLAQQLIVVSWILQIPVRLYPILGWLALGAYLAVYPALWAWICAPLAAEREGRSWAARLGSALLCAAVWVALEMTVSRMFSGFPWNMLGVSQQRLLPLLQVASVTGVYGLSFLMVWFSVSLLHAADAALSAPAARHVWLREIALPLLVTAVLYATGLHRMSSRVPPDRTLRIALIQPSIPQTMIWNSSEAGARFQELLNLSVAALTNKPDLMIWPEAAVPVPIREDPEVREAITSLARTNHVWVIIGSDDFEFSGTNRLDYNSSFLISPEGKVAATYRKRRLVIFGEYAPTLLKYFTPITGEFTPGDKPVTFTITPAGGTNEIRTSVLICFEDTFAHYAREHATTDVDFLVNITNDGWFLESAEQWQHTANSCPRGIENGIPLVRCANNGISCWIDTTGAMRDAGFSGPRDVYRAGFKVVGVPLVSAANRAPTFYNRHGDWFGWTCVAVAVAPLTLRIREWRSRRATR